MYVNISIAFVPYFPWMILLDFTFLSFKMKVMVFQIPTLTTLPCLWFLRKRLAQLHQRLI